LNTRSELIIESTETGLTETRIADLWQRVEDVLLAHHHVEGFKVTNYRVRGAFHGEYPSNIVLEFIMPRRCKLWNFANLIALGKSYSERPEWKSL
jgi:hypothetical protein